MPPDHLIPIEPAAAVQALCDRLATEIAAGEHTTAMELEAFRETRTPHDARRLANALRFVLRREDLAAEVEALLSAAGGPRNAEIVAPDS